MNYFQVIILSAVEGITEFLPLSSTGHLILTSNLLGIQQTEFQKSFEIIIQLGAILAVVCIYFQTLLKNKKIWKKVLVAFLPTGVLGYILYKFIKHYLLGNTYVVLISLFIGGIAFIVFEKMHKEKDFHLEKIETLSYKNVFLIGLFQSFSMIPGVSRAAATIFGGMILGLKRKTAVEFSFLLAIPTMFAATGLDLIKSHLSFTVNEYSQLTVGFIGAFITAYLSINYFLRYIKNHDFIPFGIYRIILAILFFLLI